MQQGVKDDGWDSYFDTLSDAGRSKLPTLVKPTTAEDGGDDGFKAYFDQLSGKPAPRSVATINGTAFGIDANVLRNEGESDEDFSARLTEMQSEKDLGDAWDEITVKSLLPFVSGASEAMDIYGLYSGVEAMQDGTATKAQQRAVLEFLIDASRESTFAYKAGSIVGDLPAFMGEFIATGGIYNLAKKGGLKLLSKGLREAIEFQAEKRIGLKVLEKSLLKAGNKTAAKAARRALGKTTVAAAGETALTRIPTMMAASELGSVVASKFMDGEGAGGRIAASTWQRALPNMGVADSPDEAGRFMVVMDDTMESFQEAFPRGLMDNYIEFVSEHAGGALTKLTGLDKLHVLQLGILEHVGKGSVSKGIQKVLKAGGWHGVMGEFLEERAGALGRALVPGMEEDFSDIFPSLEQGAAELLAFSILPAGAAGVSLAESQLRKDPLGLRGLANQVASGKAPLAGAMPSAEDGEVDAVAQAGVDRMNAEMQAGGAASTETATTEASSTQGESPSPAPTDPVSLTDVQEEHQEAASRIEAAGQAAGVAIRWYKSESGKPSEKQGMQAAGGVVLLDAALLEQEGSEQAILGEIAVHEFVHDIGSKDQQLLHDMIRDLAANNPQGFAANMEAIQTDAGGAIAMALLPEEGAAYTAQGLRTLLDYMATEEGAAWTEAYVEQADRPTLRRIVDFFRSLLKKFGIGQGSMEDRQLAELSAKIGTDTPIEDLRSGYIIHMAMKAIRDKGFQAPSGEKVKDTGEEVEDNVQPETPVADPVEGGFGVQADEKVPDTMTPRQARRARQKRNRARRKEVGDEQAKREAELRAERTDVDRSQRREPTETRAERAARLYDEGEERTDRFSVRRAGLKEAKEIVTAARRLRGVNGDGDPYPKIRVLFHSSSKISAEDLREGMYPEIGDWVREVYEGSGVDNIDEQFLGGLFFSDKPNWVEMQVARKLGKAMQDVTEADVREHGVLAVTSNVDEDGLPAYEVFRAMEDQTFEDALGESLKPWETPLYEESLWGNAKEVAGIESSDIVTVDTVIPDAVLTGQHLLDFLEWWKTQGSTDPETGEPRFSPAPDYQGAHGAPDKESGAPLSNVASNGIYPEDVYSANGLNYYGTGSDMDGEAWGILMGLRGRPNKTVRVFRAVPKDTPRGGINPGDWVTTVRRYATEHGHSSLRGEFKIREKTVRANSLFTAGDSWLEWGYDPQPFDGAARDRAREKKRAWREANPEAAAAEDARRKELRDRIDRLLGKTGEPRFSPAPVDRLGFFAQAEQAILDAAQKKYTKGQVRSRLKNGGVKDEELFWMGLDDWLKDKNGRITKDELLEFIRLQETSAAQAIMDGPAADVEALANLVEREPFASEGLNGLDIPSQRVVLSQVFRAGHNAQIRDAVIEAVPVDMMNVLVGEKGSAQELFHDEAVLLAYLPVDVDNNIATLRALDAITLATAREGAVVVLASSEIVGESGDLGPADVAGDDRASRPVLPHAGSGAVASLEDTGRGALHRQAARSTFYVDHSPSIAQSASGPPGNSEPMRESVLETGFSRFSPAPAYHGGPHEVDKFSTDFIGTGEGAQAYGWGLYFAAKKEIAEYYKRALGGRASADMVSSDGYKYLLDGVAQNEFDVSLELLGELFSYDNNRELMRSELVRMRDYYLAERDKIIEAGTKGWAAQGADFSANRKATRISHLDALAPGVVTRELPGKGYKVTLAPEEDDYLLWDEPLSGQSEKVKGALTPEAMGLSHVSVEGAERATWGFVNEARRPLGAMQRGGTGESHRKRWVDTLLGFRTGGEAYGWLGNNKAASLALLAAGIRGIKYLDGTSRSKGEGSYNYVIFDSSDVEITDRFSPKPKSALLRQLNRARAAVTRPDSVAMLGRDPLVQLAVDPEAFKELQANAPLDLIFRDWLGQRQLAEEWANKEAAKNERELAEAVGRRTVRETVGEAVQEGPGKHKMREMELAIAVYLDLGENAQEQLAEHGGELTAAQKRAYELSQNLPAPVKALADRMKAENAEMGELLVEQEIIANVVENYTARIWKQDEEGEGFVTQSVGGAKFKLKTNRAKRRTLDSILHGWALGKELQIPGAIGAQLAARKETAQVLHDRNLLAVGKKAGIFSNEQKDGYEEVLHPNFRVWGVIGQMELTKFGEGKIWDRDTYMNEDGTVFRRQPLFAPKRLADSLNRALMPSKLKGGRIADALTAMNAHIKSAILFTSLFHHQAYLRSYLYGTPFAGHGELVNPKTAYDEGQRVIEEWGPEIQTLVENGLTVGQQRDIEEDILKEKTVIGKVIDKIPVAREIKNGLLALRDQQLNFLFHRLGPQLKVMSALLEFRHLQSKHRAALEAGTITVADLAGIAANTANDDFGGLNLARKRRDPTRQHIARLMLLAPDWTESNVMSMVRTVKRGEEGKAYRDMWMRVLLRAGGATVLFNALMAGWDDDDDDPDGKDFWTRYQRSWKEGKLRWMETDITPLYRSMGGETDRRKYFSILGHFRDPIKFIGHPGRSIKHKASPLFGLIEEAATGTDWAGRHFTTWGELMGMDDKGVYKTSKRGVYRKGDPKGGKLAGESVSWQSEARGPIDVHIDDPLASTLPSYMAAQLSDMTPIQVQSLTGWLAGEMDGFDALSKGMGFMTSTTRPSDPADRLKAMEKELKDERDPTKRKQLRKQASTLRKWVRSHHKR